jgi:hypothetical protein
MKKRKQLYEPVICTLHITWSLIIQGDGIITMTPQMMTDKALEPFYKAVADHTIRDMQYVLEVDLLEKAKEMIKKSKQKY